MRELTAIASHPSLTLDEAALIRRAQKGDEDAFARLVESYDNNVLRIAYNLLRSEDEARDVYQEAFLRVFKNLDKFRFDCSSGVVVDWCEGDHGPPGRGDPQACEVLD